MPRTHFCRDSISSWKDADTPLREKRLEKTIELFGSHDYSDDDPDKEARDRYRRLDDAQRDRLREFNKRNRSRDEASGPLTRAEKQTLALFGSRDYPDLAAKQERQWDEDRKPAAQTDCVKTIDRQMAQTIRALNSRNRQLFGSAANGTK